MASDSAAVVRPWLQLPLPLPLNPAVCPLSFAITLVRAASPPLLLCASLPFVAIAMHSSFSSTVPNSIRFVIGHCVRCRHSFLHRCVLVLEEVVAILDAWRLALPVAARRILLRSELRVSRISGFNFEIFNDSGVLRTQLLFS